MNPTSKKIKAARAKAGLTQTEAAALVGVTLNGWQKWEYGTRTMASAYWELFKLKVKDLENER